MANTVQYLSGGRIQGRSDDSVVGSDEEIILDDNPSSQFSWGTGIGDYAPTTPTPSNHNNYNGVFINTNSVLKGKTLKKIKAWLCKFGSPNTSGTIRLGVMSGTGSGSTITWVTDAYVDIENLISGESGGVTLNTGFPATAVPIEITLPTAHVLAENDNIALGLTGGNYGSGTNVGWQYSDGTGVYDGSNTSRNRFSNGGWTGSGMSSDMHTTITVAGTTAKDKTSITNVPAGTRYEETDTRKIFTRTGGAAADWAEKGTSAADRLRGCYAGGSGTSNVIDYIAIAAIGNAIDFGDLTVARDKIGGVNNKTRGVMAGGGTVTNVIDYITILTTGNATDFGDLTVARAVPAGMFDTTRGCFGAGNNGGVVNVIDYITIATTGNATDFGDAIVSRKHSSGVSDATRGCICGGVIPGTYKNEIEYITIQSTGNATDFGDLSVARRDMGGVSDGTRGVIGAGDNAGGYTNILDYITIATTGNATDFGNLTDSRGSTGGVGDATRGCFGGGVSSNVIDYITILTTGNATDFGDLSVARASVSSGLAA